MKRYLKYTLFLLAVLLASCVEGNFDDSLMDDGMTVLFRVDGLAPATRAGISGTREGEDNWNENLIQSVHLFLYPKDKTNEPAVFYEKITPDPRTYSTGSFNTLVDINVGQLESLFPSANTCHAFAIANVTDEWISALPDTKLATIMNASLPLNKFGSQANTDHKQTSFIFDGYNSLTLRSMSQTRAVVGTIPLYRAAAKFTLQVHVPDTIHVMVDYVDNADNNKKKRAAQIWRPAVYKNLGTPQVEAYFEYGMPQAKAGVRYDPETYIVDGDAFGASNFFTYNKNRMKYWRHVEGVDTDVDVEGVNIVTDGGLKYMISDPSYTYPQTWTEGLETEPFYKLCLPWSLDEVMEVYGSVDGDGKLVPDQVTSQAGVSPTFKQFYYKIVFPMVDYTVTPHKGTILSNNWYKLKLKVGVLGSETDDAAVSLESTYMVANWQNQSEVVEQAEVGNARYLSVANNFYEMYNTVNLAIPYTSSDDCEIVSAVWRQPYYGTSTSSQYTNDTELGCKVRRVVIFNDSGTAVNADGWSFDISDGKTIRLTHSLVNTLGSGMDATPYYIDFTIRHKDAHSYSKTIRVIQYPSLYIKTLPGGAVFVDGYYRRVYGTEKPDTGGSGNGNGPFSHTGTFYPGGNSGNYGGARVTPYGNLANSDPSSQRDMTIINVSAFSSGDDTFSYSLNGTQTFHYIIADPRVPWGSDSIISNWDLTPYLWRDGTTKNWTTGNIMLSTNRQDIIAPAFMLASEWGRQGDGESSFETVVKRCATYQEAGYPAGRWRVPTMAEAQYTIALQRYGCIGELYKGGTYWVSNGLTVTRDGSVANGGGNSTRCVYDVWYWGEDPVSEYDSTKPKYILGME